MSETGTPRASEAATAAPGRPHLRLSPEGWLRVRRGEDQAYAFDLRPVEDYRAGHLAGAFHLPWPYLADSLRRLPFAGTLLFYDGGEGVAARAAGLVHEHGFTDAYYVAEGWAALRAAVAASPEEPQYGALPPEARRQAVERVLDDKVRGYVQGHGGGLEVAGVEEGRVLVRYRGVCGACPASTAGTLRLIQYSLAVALNEEIEVVPVDGA